MRLTSFLFVVSGYIFANGEPNPPSWPSTVIIFSPSMGMDTIQTKVNSVYQEQGGRHENGQFSSDRYALMFKPGTYSVDVPVGYYTSIYGLGETPQQVMFSGGDGKGVYCEEGSYSPIPGALDNFWRSAENFATATNYAWFDGAEGSGMLWAASQAAPLRRTIVQNSLVLFEYVKPYLIAGMASGGFMANVKVGHTVNTGSQQQWLSRNSETSGFKDGVWNMVMVGCKGTPAPHCGAVAGSSYPYVVIPSTEIIAEKPFITITSSGKYNLQIPPVKTNTQGVDHTLSGYTTVGFEKVYVTQVGDSAATINQKLSAGLHVVVSPGQYKLTEPLVVRTNGQVILCLGIATLISSAGNIIITVSPGLKDVRIAGCLLQAGPKETKVLLRWGEIGDAGSPTNPGVISDMYARVGGPDKTQVIATMMMQINSGNVIIDNAWLWRADHAVPCSPTCREIKSRENPCVTALEVNGDNVHAYGLAAEHTLGNLVEWNGNNGKTFMFQAEYPYDVTQAQYTGFAAYKVAANVTSHQGYGVGIYHFFRDYPVTVPSGISCPESLVNSFVDSLGVYLNGSGTMTHIINSHGEATSQSSPTADPGAHPAWFCH